MACACKTKKRLLEYHTDYRVKQHDMKITTKIYNSIIGFINFIIILLLLTIIIPLLLLNIIYNIITKGKLQVTLPLFMQKKIVAVNKANISTIRHDIIQYKQ